MGDNRILVVQRGARALFEKWLDSGKSIAVWCGNPASIPGGAGFTPHDSRPPEWFDGVRPSHCSTRLEDFAFVRGYRVFDRFRVRVLPSTYDGYTVFRPEYEERILDYLSEPDSWPMTFCVYDPSTREAVIYEAVLEGERDR